MNMRESDEQIVVKVRGSDKEAFSEIIRRYEGKLTHYLRKFIRDNDELEDVLQDVFIKAYRNLYGFDIDKKFSSWLYRIAHNEALNHIKKYSKETVRLDEGEWEIMDIRFDANEAVDAGFMKERIENALASIKRKYRETLILYFFEQKTYDEISYILRVPRSTVGIWIMRGKNAIKKFLNSKQYGY